MTARHCQSKFYTACSLTSAGWSSTVFAHESPTRSAEFDAENRLYLFALTVPQARLADRLRALGVRVGLDADGEAVVALDIPESAVATFSKRDRQVIGKSQGLRQG